METVSETNGQLKLKLDDKKTENQCVMEAVLFALSRAVSLAELSHACGISLNEAQSEITRLMAWYNEGSGGLMIKEVNGCYQMCTSPQYFESLVKVVSAPRKAELSDVLMETLAIIANKSPATKVDIERIRGVKSDFAVNKLVEYGLVEEAGRLAVPGRPILFKPTEEFYRRFGIENSDSMPRVGEEMESRISDEVNIEVRNILADETVEGAGNGTDSGV